MQGSGVVTGLYVLSSTCLVCTYLSSDYVAKYVHMCDPEEWKQGLTGWTKGFDIFPSTDAPATPPFCLSLLSLLESSAPVQSPRGQCTA